MCNSHLGPPRLRPVILGCPLRYVPSCKTSVKSPSTNCISNTLGRPKIGCRPAKFQSCSNGNQYVAEANFLIYQTCAHIKSSLLSSAKRYTKDHEWIEYDDATHVGTMSVTDYAQNSLGDVVFVELPTVGAKFDQGGQHAASIFRWLMSDHIFASSLLP